MSSLNGIFGDLTIIHAAELQIAAAAVSTGKKFATGLYTDDLESIGPMTTYYASCMRIGG